MNGKLIVKTPFLCGTCVKIDGVFRSLNPLKRRQIIELAFGTHRINAGVEIYDDLDRGHPGGTEWAWEKSKEITIDEKDTYLVIKRKWHLLRSITAEATIERRST